MCQLVCTTLSSYSVMNNYIMEDLFGCIKKNSGIRVLWNLHGKEQMHESGWPPHSITSYIIFACHSLFFWIVSELSLLACMSYIDMFVILTLVCDMKSKVLRTGVHCLMLQKQILPTDSTTGQWVSQVSFSQGLSISHCKHTTDFLMDKTIFIHVSCMKRVNAIWSILAWYVFKQKYKRFCPLHMIELIDFSV